jgi:cation transport regulator ChaC
MSDHSLSYEYVFGFGSIMDTSTHATWQTSEASSPMLGSVATISKSFGYQRQWNFRSSTGFTALGVSKADREEERYNINGVLFQVPTDEMPNFDRREAGYERVSVPLQMLTFHSDICGTHKQAHFNLTQNDRIWIYIPLASHTMYADENHPLLQSYVDTVMRGCLEWGGESMAEEFLSTTGGWSCHFLNDTPSSRRPWLHRKEYNTIDALLMKHSQETHFGDRRHPEEFAASFNQRMRGTWSVSNSFAILYMPISF